jgi:hypothetical protein
MPSGIQKWPPKSTPSPSGEALSEPIMLSTLGAMKGAPFASWPARMTAHQCGCDGPNVSARSSSLPQASIFATTVTDKLMRSSIVNAPDGLTAAGKSAQESVPGSGSKRTRR